MHGALEIALDVFWLLAIIGGGGWIFWHSLKHSEDPSKNLFKLIFTILLATGEIFFARRMIGNLHEGDGNQPVAIVLVLSIAAVCIVIGVMWTPQITAFVLSPLTNAIDGGTEAPDNKPFYSIANTQRKKGNYAGAVDEVRRQLDKYPGDFEGIMLLAAIHAENQNDLPGAENVLNRFCERKDAPDVQVAAAWTAMADWHMKYGVDVDSAQASLQKIVARFPETELALKAEQRLAHLSATEKILMEQHDRPKIQMREGAKNLGLMDSTEFIKPKEIEPGRLAAAYVKQLEAHPHDSEAREKLATIYARDFQRLDLATMELGHLINEPRHSPKQVAGWLNLLANFQLELGADMETVRATLMQIIQNYPDLPIAEVTRRRLERLSHDFKSKEKAPGVQLGAYEQNIGLKYGRPPQHQ